MKKLLPLIVIIILSCLMTVNAFAATSIDIGEAWEFAEEFLDEYYHAYHLYEEHDFSKYLSSDIQNQFINNMMQTNLHIHEFNNSPERTDYYVEFELLESKDLGDCVTVFAAMRASYRYPNADFMSGCGQGVYLVIVDTQDGLKIADHYLEDEPYYQKMRGFLNELNDPYFWDSVSLDAMSAMQESYEITALESLAQMQAELELANAGAIVEIENATESEIEESDSVRSSGAVVSYMMEANVTVARTLRQICIA